MNNIYTSPTSESLLSPEGLSASKKIVILLISVVIYPVFSWICFAVLGKVILTLENGANILALLSKYQVLEIPGLVFGLLSGYLILKQLKFWGYLFVPIGAAILFWLLMLKFSGFDFGNINVVFIVFILFGVVFKFSPLLALIFVKQKHRTTPTNGGNPAPK